MIEESMLEMLIPLSSILRLAVTLTSLILIVSMGMAVMEAAARNSMNDMSSVLFKVLPVDH